MRVLGTAGPGEVRAVLVDDEAVLEVAISRAGAGQVGDLHRGRVRAVAPAMAGAFVALADGDGFLPDSEGAAGRGEGDVLGVRVSRAAQGGKGPRLTARLTEGEAALVGTGAPALLRRGPDAVSRLAAAYPGVDIRVDDRALHARLRPVLGDRVAYEAGCFGDAIEAEIEALGEPGFILPGGMRGSVFPTPALTAIDLDLGSGASTRTAKPAALLQANRAALPDLARQIRARNLAGAILIDFAGLGARRRATLGPLLTAALAADPMAPRLLGFTHLGLAEILRPRLHPPLHDLLRGPHAASLAALRALECAQALAPAARHGLEVSPSLAASLAADPAACADFAARNGGAPVRHTVLELGGCGWRIIS